MELKLVKNEKKYYDFIRIMRIHPENQVGFLEKVNITEEQQLNYMKRYNDCYYVCLMGDTPLGYVGVVEDDIRICTDPTHKKTGAGTFMLNEIIKIFPSATAKILKDNTPSINLFKKCGFKIVNSDENLYYLNKKNEL
jgi:RimJ/RimL family protein N-acetyltransferase